MGRRKAAGPMFEVPYPCHFECGRKLVSKYTITALEWEWFTGYGERPIHFCPTCRRSRQFEIDRIREKLNVKPKDYPKVRATL